MSAATLAIAATWLWLGCTPVSAGWHQTGFDVMGTRATVELWSDDAQLAGELFTKIEAELRRIEQLMSPYIESSELSAINRLGANRAMPISAEMHRVLASAQEFSKLTGGAFDISFASVGNLYDYRASVQPSGEQLANSLVSIGYRHILLDQPLAAEPQHGAAHTIQFSHENMRIDLGGIAKGYAVDQGIAILRAHNIQSGLVAAGGDTRIIGDRGVNKETGERLPWVIGIKHPRAENKQAFRLPLSDTAISTSGDYERFFIQGEQRVHHIIHPSTGLSASGVVSTTVIGPESMHCDALSTSVFVLGVERGLELINKLAGYDAILIDSAGKVHYSQGLEGQ